MPHDDLPANSGKVLTEHHVALYRDQYGALRTLSSVCTHMGCDVGWNDVDKVWVCPCHGSRFSPEGQVIKGPAVKSLQQVPLAPDRTA